MTAREYRSILRSLSPVEREMLRDLDAGSVMPRTQARWKPRLAPLLTYWQARAETQRIAKLIAAAELDQLNAGTYRGPHAPGGRVKRKRRRVKATA